MPAASIGRRTKRVSALSSSVQVSTQHGLIAVPSVLSPVGAAQHLRARRKHGAVRG